MKLSAEQEETVRNYVEAQKLTLESLKEDIIDHLCCVIEAEPRKEKSFEYLLNEAVTTLAPNGLIEIENKTKFLLNSKRILVMKKLMYLLGFISSVALTGGAAFKLLHFPGANQLFMVSYLTLFLGFLPLLAFDHFKASVAKALPERLKITLGITSSIILGLAGIFKIMHLQGAHLLLMFGTIVFAAGFLPFLFFTMYKREIS